MSINENNNNNKQDNRIWSEKYRPKNLDELFLPADKLDQIEKLLFNKNKNGFIPNIIFYGPPGTGKTTLSKLLIKINYKEKNLCVNDYVLELNASDDNGINVIRNRVKNFVSIVPPDESYCKLVILDECDGLTIPAQLALKKMIEQYYTNTRFCLTANVIQKLNPELMSRFIRIQLYPLRNEILRKKIEMIEKMENFKIENDKTYTLICKMSNNDMRKCINLLEKLYLCLKDKDKNDTIIINDLDVYKTNNYPSPKDSMQIFNNLMQKDMSTNYSYIIDLINTKGFNLLDIINETMIIINLPNKEKLFDNEDRIFLYEQIADLEYRLYSPDINIIIQISAFIGIFYIIRERIKEKCNYNKLMNVLPFYKYSTDSLINDN
jgi:replication factor C subunit 3/5